LALIKASASISSFSFRLTLLLSSINLFLANAADDCIIDDVDGVLAESLSGTGFEDISP
jgi:hypothetical protein